VAHFKAQGDFQYLPVAQEIRSNGDSAQYPQGILWDAYQGESNISSTVDARFGLGLPDSYATIRYSGDYRWTHHVVLNGNPYNFDTLYLYSNGYGGMTTNSSTRPIDRKLYTFKSLSNGQLTFEHYWERRYYVPNKFAKTWAEFENNPDLIKRAWDESPVGDIYASGNPGYSLQCYRSKVNPSMSVSAFRGWINTQLIPSLEELHSTIEGVHFGELAMDATAKVNRNQSNMIAFFRDLRDPKAMLLKLKNLKNIKVHANNYLAVQYGILPTISDLQNIVNAFKAREPYLDRHGYQTYTAVRSNASSNGVFSESLEQRIKVAIENEDDDFKRLAQAVESAGFALTLENVWDLIPYSFVVDWFVGVGDFLERADSRMRISKLNIRYATMSQKSIKERYFLASKSYPYSGTLKLVQYSRWTEDHCPVPPLFFQNTPTVSNHWLEASALLIQRSK
jgi:hypothetical protein